MVYARIAPWKFKKGQREEGIKTLGLEELNSIVNIPRGKKDFRGYLIFFHADDPDAAVIITLWDSEESLNKSRKELVPDALREIEKYMENPPDADLNNYKLDSAELLM